MFNLSTERKTNDNRYTLKTWMKSIDPNSTNDITFIRKGIIGGYKDDMSKEYADRIDKWYAESGSLNQGYNWKD